MTKKKTYSVTINRNFLATIGVTVDVNASDEEGAKEIALQRAKDNDIPVEEYNLDHILSQGAEVIRTGGFEGIAEIADVSEVDDELDGTDSKNPVCPDCSEVGRSGCRINGGSGCDEL
jgi:hypothetical protein